MQISFERPDGTSGIIFVDATISENHDSAAAVTDHPVEAGTNISDNVRPENDILSMELLISNHPTVTPLSHADGAQMELRGSSLVLSTARRPLQRRQDGNPKQIVQSVPPSSLRDGAGAVAIGASIGAGRFGGQAGIAGLALTGAGSLRTPGVKPVFEAQLITPATAESVEGAATFFFSSEFNRARAVYEELLRILKGGIPVRIDTTLRSYENMVLLSMNVLRDVDNANVLRAQVATKEMRFVTTRTVKVTDPVQNRAKKKVERGNQPPAPVTSADNRTHLLQVVDWFNLKLGDNAPSMEP